jgi:hypothetical protein
VGELELVLAKHEEVLATAAVGLAYQHRAGVVEEALLAERKLLVAQVDLVAVRQAAQVELQVEA